ncbi:NADPH:quinone oxidoreductase [Sphingomonas sp. Root50]|nr:NADPH:quinone oxidoreductase [Sphingomonas sp. Root1294]KQY68994.1 NADPH:quinone oxidoreductase [Sphingomonas sp. Root50]KRB89249.1 NADPH:quinone oxidoreductase [Sphingomonas sp. Root720]
MRALISGNTGGPESLALGELPEPVAGPGEVVVQVRACGVNYPDTLIIADRYQFRPERPFAPGAEIAGIVESVGSAVDGFAPGQRILAMINWGGMAEKACVPAARCIAMPDAMPFDEGAAFLMTYGTAYHALHQRGRIRPGETLLVLGAAGGVGLAAIEIGRAAGAHVIAAASSDAKLAVAMAKGADAGFVYARDASAKELAVQFKAACGAKGADLVFDPVGGALSEAAMRTCAWDGRLLVIGFPGGIAQLPLNLVLLKGAAVVGVFYGLFMDREPEENARNNRALLDLYAAGAIRPLISQRFPLERGAEAIAALSRREAHGKLVVEISEG